MFHNVLNSQVVSKYLYAFSIYFLFSLSNQRNLRTDKLLFIFHLLKLDRWKDIIIIIIIIIILLFWEFFTPALDDGISMEFEWQ